MYAYAHARDVKLITVTTIAGVRSEISEKTPTGNGLITSLATGFKSMTKPAPFSFIWKPEKNVPAALFTSLKYGEDFSFELRILELDGDNLRSSFHFNFYQCKFLKSRIQRGKVKVDGTYGIFEKSPD